MFVKKRLPSVSQALQQGYASVAPLSKVLSIDGGASWTRSESQRPERVLFSAGLGSWRATQPLKTHQIPTASTPD